MGALRDEKLELKHFGTIIRNITVVDDTKVEL